MALTTSLKRMLTAGLAVALCAAAPAIAQPGPDPAADVPTCNGSNNDRCIPRGGMGGGHHGHMMTMHRHMHMHKHPMHGHHHKPHHKPHHHHH